MPCKKSDAALHHQRCAKRPHEDNEIVAAGWTRAQCRAIEMGLGGGFLLMAALEAVMGI